MKPKKPIESLILNVRGQKVILDADLAELYDVPTKVFNQAVKRNADRFPDDFMFQLSAPEWRNLKSQIVTSSLEASPKEALAPNWSQLVTSSKSTEALLTVHTPSPNTAPLWPPPCSTAPKPSP